MDWKLQPSLSVISQFTFRVANRTGSRVGHVSDPSDGETCSIRVRFFRPANVAIRKFAAASSGGDIISAVIRSCSTISSRCHRDADGEHRRRVCRRINCQQTWSASIAWYQTYHASASDSDGYVTSTSSSQCRKCWKSLYLSSFHYQW